MRMLKVIQAQRGSIGIAFAVLFAPIAEIIWIRASELGGSDSWLPCLLVGALFLWITPYKIIVKIVLLVLYLVLMTIALFVIGATLECGLYHSCL